MAGRMRTETIAPGKVAASELTPELKRLGREAEALFNSLGTYNIRREEMRVLEEQLRAVTKTLANAVRTCQESKPAL